MFVFPKILQYSARKQNANFLLVKSRNGYESIIFLYIIDSLSNNIDLKASGFLSEKMLSS